jgi:triosephosphate isomerase
MTVPLVVGNWKMNGSQAECQKLARELAREIQRKATRVQVIVAPPFTALTTVARAIRHSKIKMAAQNCHWQESGAYTGEISAPMIAELGCEFVILGHSERRHILHESDEMIARKIAPVMAHGMRAILCVGETLEERRQKLTGRVIARQLRSALKGSTKDVIDNLEIAYEPVWAIGTGKVATPEQAQAVHAFIRKKVLAAIYGADTASKIQIQYGGSMKADNAATLLSQEDIDGGLIGGAALKAEDFKGIVLA